MDSAIIDKIEQLGQRQDSQYAQMVDLHKLAVKLGMYDAADWIVTNYFMLNSGRK